MKEIICSAPGRMALVGNPFDIYGGMTISMTLKDLRSIVHVKKAEEQIIHSDIFRPGNQRTSQRRQLELATIETLDLQHHKFEYYDGSNMPYESALARSTAVVVAMIRAFSQLFGRGGVANYELAEQAWATERKLGVCGGQERYAIAFDYEELSQEESIHLLADIKAGKKKLSTRPGKLFFMDFKGREDHYFNGHNYAKIEELPLPEVNFAIAFQPEGARLNSFSVHQKLREKYVSGGKELIDGLRDRSNTIVKKAYENFVNGFDVNILGECMKDSLKIRMAMQDLLLADELKGQPLCEETLKMIAVAEELNLIGYNQPGSKSLCFIYAKEEDIKAFVDKGYQVIKVCNS